MSEIGTKIRLTAQRLHNDTALADKWHNHYYITINRGNIKALSFGPGKMNTVGIYDTLMKRLLREIINNPAQEDHGHTFIDVMLDDTCDSDEGQTLLGVHWVRNLGYENSENVWKQEVGLGRWHIGAGLYEVPGPPYPHHLTPLWDFINRWYPKKETENAI